MERIRGTVAGRDSAGEGRGVGGGVRPAAPGRHLRPLDVGRLPHLVEAELR